MGRNLPPVGKVMGDVSADTCAGCHAAIDSCAEVKRIAIDAADFQHLNGVYHVACAQPVVMLLSVLGFLNLQSAPEAAPPTASDKPSHH